MAEPTNRSERILTASKLVGLAPKQNLEWLVDFAQRDFRSLEEDPNFEKIAADLWDQWCVLVWAMSVTILQADVRLTAKEIRDAQSAIRSVLMGFAKGEVLGTFSFVRVATVVGLGKRPAIESTVATEGQAPDHTSSFLGACGLLFEKCGSLQLALCAYSKCPRGRDLGRLGRVRRLFVQNRHSKYCCRACGNNAASDRYLDNPKNKKRRLENRKRLRAAKPAEHK